MIGYDVPDVSVFEYAREGGDAYSGGKMVKVGMVSFFCAFLCALGIAAYDVGLMRIKASREFAVAFGKLLELTA